MDQLDTERQDDQFDDLADEASEEEWKQIADEHFQLHGGDC